MKRSLEVGLPSIMTTNEAAKAINRKPATLRKWACLENGPIRPLRINGRLAWRLEDIARLLEEGENKTTGSFNGKEAGQS